MAKRVRPGKSGRDSGAARFIQLWHRILDCEAYRSLAPVERVLLIELMRRYSGRGSRGVGLGIREGSVACRANRKTVAAAFHTLQERGFIALAVDSNFHLKTYERQTRTWFLEMCDFADRPATWAFANWSASKIHGPVLGHRLAPITGQGGPNEGTDGRRDTPNLAPDSGQIGTEGHKSGPSNGPLLYNHISATRRPWSKPALVDVTATLGSLYRDEIRELGRARVAVPKKPSRAA